jgi:hypothetical protein
MPQQHQHRSELEKVIIPELIENDLEHENKSQDSSDNENSLLDEDEENDSPTEEELELLEAIPEATLEHVELESKSKNSKPRKIYVPKPEFNRVTR